LSGEKNPPAHIPFDNQPKHHYISFESIFRTAFSGFYLERMILDAESWFQRQQQLAVAVGRKRREAAGRRQDAKAVKNRANLKSSIFIFQSSMHFFIH
jgi:hypothetical protein